MGHVKRSLQGTLLLPISSMLGQHLPWCSRYTGLSELAIISNSLKDLPEKLSFASAQKGWAKNLCANSA